MRSFRLSIKFQLVIRVLRNRLTKPEAHILKDVRPTIRVHLDYGYNLGTKFEPNMYTARRTESYPPPLAKIAHQV